MYGYRSFRYLIVLITVTISITSCHIIYDKPKPKTRNFICVVDFSSATNSQERQAFYMTVIKNNIIKQLALTDRITVLPVDKASVTNSSEILIIDLSIKDFEPDASSPMETDKITQENFSKFKDSLGISFETCFNKSVSNRTLQNQGTDLFGALNNVKGYIKTNADNYIVFLSDMMNYTNTLIMEPSNPNFSKNNLDAILNKLSGINLPNTTVLVLTADQPGLTTEHFDLVKTFWTQYFNRNKIKLYDYSSASVSKLNDLMSLPISK